MLNHPPHVFVSHFKMDSFEYDLTVYPVAKWTLQNMIDCVILKIKIDIHFDQDGGGCCVYEQTTFVRTAGLMSPDVDTVRH